MLHADQAYPTAVYIPVFMLRPLSSVVFSSVLLRAFNGNLPSSPLGNIIACAISVSLTEARQDRSAFRHLGRLLGIWERLLIPTLMLHPGFTSGHQQDGGGLASEFWRVKLGGDGWVVLCSCKDCENQVPRHCEK